MFSVTMVQLFICLGVLSVVTIASKDNDLNEPSKNRYELVPQCQDALNEQVNEELHASLVYMSMAAHFGSSRVARGGFRKFYDDNAKEERDHAQKIIDYINKRAGQVSNFEVKMPLKVTWETGLESLEDALQLEEHVNNKLHHLHDVAERVCKDPHLMDFIEGEFLEEQVESIDQLKRHIAVLGAMNIGMGEFFVDKQFQSKEK